MDDGRWWVYGGCDRRDTSHGGPPALRGGPVAVCPGGGPAHGRVAGSEVHGGMGAKSQLPNSDRRFTTAITSLWWEAGAMRVLGDDGHHCEGDDLVHGR